MVQEFDLKLNFDMPEVAFVILVEYIAMCALKNYKNILIVFP